ncbi:hypothetical protein BRADI_4g09976v3 [Brachypodium distachyon]|uniref:ACT domain-containing protein ACR n=1 Tax=Brachypodium distachyon TaxID=15368 RepID=A0A2K2CLQ8_BRADI|nr:hypothetical protein BRADI_4g09976v3 [Brachypodium distachyon]
MTTSLTDYHDAELNRLRVVIDNDASDRATVIRVEILSRLWVLTCAINEHGLLIHDSDLHYHSRLWHGAISVTDDDGNKIADERTITDIRTAIEDMERQHLTRMNALWHDDFLASLGWNIKDTWDTWDSFDLGEAMVKQKLRADLENQTPRSKCYNIDLDVSKAEEVLLHRRILAECADADKHPVVHARFFGYFDSQEDKLPAVGSSRTEKGNPGASVASNSRGSTKDTQFSFSPSGMSGIDLMVGSGSVHVPKHYSVHHPVVQMVLFATVLSDDFDHKYFMMPKAALNIKKKLPWFYIVYGDGSVVAKAHVSKFRTGVVCFSKHPNANEVFLGYTSATYRCKGLVSYWTR